ncbi:MAG: hypothetical protein K2Q09_00765, partial [Phycisphaerales bacterium]|nr:hypothetical protein [Phycisphaerales bacterium]
VAEHRSATGRKTHPIWCRAGHQRSLTPAFGRARADENSPGLRETVSRDEKQFPVTRNSFP